MRLSFPSSGSWLLGALAVVAAMGACSDDAGSGGGTTSSTTGSTTGPTSGSTTNSTTSSSSSTTGTGGGGGCQSSLPTLDEPPDLLSETGLYADITTDTIASNVRAFQPLYPLWSDAAEKQRWVYLPECEPIDTSNMDAWEMPVGTRLWKQFTRDGVRVETRMITRTGPGPTDFKFAAYQWSLDLADATRLPDPLEGVDNANGTPHDIPAESLCSGCHRKDWRVLGFSAVQLTHSLPGETIASLSSEGKLTTPLPDGIVVPGDAGEQAALGYLHANCASCHNQEASGVPSLYFKILQENTDVMSTDTYTTAVNQMATMFPCGCDRIEPGDPAASAVIQRMSVRGTGAQMPQIATEVVDDVGVQKVSDWISQLPP